MDDNKETEASAEKHQKTPQKAQTQELMRLLNNSGI